MNRQDADRFKDAMDAKLGILTNMDSWMVVKQEALIKIIGWTWAFEIKCFPNSIISKLKACLCVCREQQIDGVDVPVVNFTTVWLSLVLSNRLGWAMVHIDHTAAFVNEKADKDMFVKMPRGYHKEGH
eukprot:4260782-Ditylum_brightwellii.AAC.1